jgi:acetyl esterase/lipase
MRTTAIGFSLLLAVGMAGAGHAADAPPSVTLDLWPGQPPGEVGTVGEDKAETRKGETTVAKVTYVKTPSMTVFLPERDKSNGAAVIICPGGGYRALMWDYEGTDAARWLNSIGVAGIVLKYRIPRREGTPDDTPPVQALIDAQRAVSLVRSKAADWQIDPKRVGILGFSAGAHLSAWTATNFDKRAYDAADDVDRIDCRPDFAVLVYPGGIVKKDTDQLLPQIRVTSQTPPMFFAHATNDRVSVDNSVYLYLALKRAGVPGELHLYADGGHGFGMRPSKLPCATWPNRCEEWLAAQGFLKPGAKP